MTIKILVCGGRDYHDKDKVFSSLNQIVNPDSLVIYSSPLIITGGAKGADTLADEWAIITGADRHIFYADWKTHGKAAGAIRNQQMLDEGKPDMVVAFPGGRGTADMVRRSKKAGIEVIEIE